MHKGYLPEVLFDEMNISVWYAAPPCFTPRIGQQYGIYFKTCALKSHWWCCKNLRFGTERLMHEMKHKLQSLTFYLWLTERPSPDPRSARRPLRPSRSLITFRVCSFVEGKNGTWENITPDLFSFSSFSQLLSIKERNVRKVKAPLVWKGPSVQACRTWPRVHRLREKADPISKVTLGLDCWWLKHLLLCSSRMTSMQSSILKCVQ